MAMVLIAEDNADVCMVLKRVLTVANFDVVTAPDGTTALDLAVAQHPDVVLTDLDMPGLTGLELTEALRGHPVERGVPILILSGSLQRGDPRAAAAGVCDVRLKPFTNRDLVAAVQHLADIGRHRHDQGSSPCPLQPRPAAPADPGALADA
ncbi:response regulator [Virgisporangium aurantiacum]|uniref:Response regulator n=1 Tax=Virgisporangium aurantiacum TaxID=175570 RepID=A0A8J4E2D0_9ACTN|nr:response regulator [Virgisporangium aurantiacum]GIJ56907.1 response regulator [Virgisporangium aurantiacum]